ncbi:MAG: sulfotransferase family 2 domain-containing protein [Methylovulum sp.]|nr:sulfotransferase family 2 domain-containing protein [Methylovulum sp.]
MQDKQLVHFLHIGKTGGSAIKLALTQTTNNSHYTFRYRPHQIILRDVPEGEKVVFFLRDPISRFISGFYSRLRQGKPKYFAPWSDLEKVAFEYFHTPKQLAQALSSDDAGQKAKAEEAMNNIQHINQSYWRWFDNEVYLRRRQTDIFFIGRQEHLNKDFEMLKTKLDVTDGIDLPDNDVEAHRNPANLDKALDPVAIENLQQWYKKDYLFIKICKEIVKSQGITSSLATPP